EFSGSGCGVSVTGGSGIGFGDFFSSPRNRFKGFMRCRRPGRRASAAGSLAGCAVFWTSAFGVTTFVSAGRPGTSCAGLNTGSVAKLTVWTFAGGGTKTAGAGFGGLVVGAGLGAGAVRATFVTAGLVTNV